MSRYWTDERDAALKRLLQEGRSASQIAAEIGAASRNAILGRVHRLGLASKFVRNKSLTLSLNAKLAHKTRKAKGKGKPFTFQTAPNMVRTPPMAPAPLPMPAADDKARVSFNDLEPHHCRWPVGETAGIRLDTPIFCGLTKMPGSRAYCPGHYARAHNIVTPRPPAVSAPAPVKRELVEAA